MILQGSVVTQTMLGGPTIYPLVTNLVAECRCCGSEEHML